MARLKILFAVSECVPFAKTGGLADVAGALPTALARRGHDVRVVMPRYKTTKAWPTVALPASFGVDTGVGTLWCGVHRGQLDGEVPVYLLEHDALYERDGIYGDVWGGFGDNCLRYTLLSRGALALRGYLGFSPDLIHVHDWQTALVPVELAARRERLATVMTIHNLGYQGVFDVGESVVIGHEPARLAELGVEHFGSLNLLKGGIVNATCLSTVSPRYAAEIQSSEGGAGLDGELRRRGDALVGILNGIDDETWNPATDRHLPAQYGIYDLSNKAHSKRHLQRKLGLPERSDVPLFGVVSRFVPQKGIDVLADALALVLHLDLQIAVLGAGEVWAEELFSHLSVISPKVGAKIGYDEHLAHLIEAGSDLFLMPSRYEPCGLNQLYSQRYGTPPIVRAVGGLMDTVTHEVDGFVFGELSAAALATSIVHAADTFRHRAEHFRAMQLNGMRKRLGWDQAATHYEALYRLAISRAGREAVSAG